MAPQPPIRVSLNINVDVPLAGLSSEAVDELLALTKRLREIHDQAEKHAEATRLLTEAIRTPKQPRRVCGHCGKPLVRKQYLTGKLEPLPAFEQRQYCDRKCSRRGTAAKGSVPAGRAEVLMKDGRSCEVCGKPLVRKRRADGKLERLTVFSRRRTCGRVCGNTLQRGTRKPGSGRRKKPKPTKPEPAPEHDETLSAPADVAPAVPWSPPEPSSPVTMRPAEGTATCPVHGDALGAFGCPACNAGRRWREGERERPKVVVSASNFGRKGGPE
jgi:ssDNA-binding Zn-finger/Zn-ribbon topoisomerase 1